MRVLRSRLALIGIQRSKARDIAKTDAYVASSYARKKVRLRGPNGAKDEFHLAAMVQNLRKLAELVPKPA